jgi:DNA repair exonuclease SbcCD ATPase subunit
LKINLLEIHNILSIEHATVKFEDSGLVLVEGFDYDTGRANGAGKSAIFNALSFALYDKLPRRVTKSEILRKGTKTGFSYVELSTHEGVFSVKRSRPSAATYFKNGKEIDITQQEFEDKIGLNYEQFLITMYTAQDTMDKFINLNDTGKKNFILKIMNLGNFTSCKQEVSESIKSLGIERELLKTKMEGYKSNVSIYKSSIIDPEHINAKIAQNDKDVEFYKSQIKQLEDVKEPDLSKFRDAEKKVQDRLMNIQSTKVLCNSKIKELNQLKNMTPDTICPECNADLNIVNGHAHKANDQTKINERIEIVKTQIREYQDDIDKEQELKEFAKKIQNKKQEEYADYNAAVTSISEYRNSINLKTAENNSLRQQVERNDDIKTKIVDIVTQAKQCSSKIEEINDNLFLLEAVESVFDTTGAPAYVMDSIVDSFNEAVSDYVSEIWPNATYALQTYKTNKDKSVKAKFSETLTINGKETSIGSLSGGELRALSLALDFAIVDILSSNYGLALNPVILDEPFNGLDSTGRELVVDILTKFSINRQVWVIDHASEAKAMFNKVVRIEKRNGVSKIA